jgi:hypothetical protein
LIKSKKRDEEDFTHAMLGTTTHFNGFDKSQNQSPSIRNIINKSFSTLKSKLKLKKAKYKTEQPSEAASESELVESSYNEGDFEEYQEAPYSKIDEFSPVKSKELLDINLLIEKSHFDRTKQSRVKEKPSPKRKLQRNIFETDEVSSPGCLYKKEMNSFRNSNPTFRMQEQAVRQKDLKMFKQRKKYKLLSQEIFITQMKKNEKQTIKKF